ncbi:RHOMBOID-like protein 2 [Asparagus officinalis]|nr:RHOMBOID-like protein 2 [Asparagus officinalis]
MDSGTWKHISGLKIKALNCIRKAIGNGESTSLWFDPWLHEGRIIELVQHLSPQLTGTENWTVSSIIQNSQWNITLPCLMPLVNAISEIQISGKKDQWFWLPAVSGTFSFASAWDQVRTPFALFELYNVVWFPSSVPKMACCLMKGLYNRLASRDRLSKFGISSLEECVLCTGEKETRDHLFFQCPYTDIQDLRTEATHIQQKFKEKREALATESRWSLILRAERAWTSWIVPMIVVANVIVFVVVMGFNNCPSHVSTDRFGSSCVAGFLHRFSFQPLRENPLFGPSSSTLERLGALKWDKVVYQHQGWRLITCIWLHAGVIHLIANMLSLVFIGIRLEQQFGFIRIGLIYLIAGFGGSVLSSLFIRNSISVGASGALFGLLGAMLSELFTNWTIYTNKAAAILTLLIIIVINLAIGILPHVDNFAHIGGFLTGLLLGFVLLMRPQFGWIERRYLPQASQVNSKYKAHQYVLFIFALLLLIVGFAVGLVMLFRGENGYDHCHWCHYLSCVPTSSWSCGT